MKTDNLYVEKFIKIKTEEKSRIYLKFFSLDKISILKK